MLLETFAGQESSRQDLVFQVRRWISDDDRRQFHEDGYMVIRSVIPADLAQNAVREIAAFLGADPEDSATWYSGAPELDGIVPMHHAQSLWDIRQCPNLYQVFSEFFGSGRLMVDMNRCIFCPPIHPRLPVSYGNIHWDTDPRKKGPGSLQAVVLLTDVGRDGGGFQCLPEVYRNLDAWLERNASRSDFNFFEPGLNRWKTTQVAGSAGDVILWSTRLPHGTAANWSLHPRVASFVSMQPPAADSAKIRESMKAWWLAKRAPDYWRGLLGQVDPEPGPPAELSELGLKLIGVLSW